MLASALLVGAAVSDAAASQRRVAILKFSGPQAGRFQGATTKLVRESHEVIAHARYRQAARRLRARRITPANIAKVAAELRADGVLECRVRRRAKRYHLTCQLRSGETGDPVTSFAFTSRRPSLSPYAQQQLRTQLADAIGKLPLAGAAVGGRHEDGTLDRLETDEEGLESDEGLFSSEEQDAGDLNQEEAHEGEALHGQESSFQEMDREDPERHASHVPAAPAHASPRDGQLGQYAREARAEREHAASLASPRRDDAAASPGYLAAGPSLTIRKLSFWATAGLANAPRNYAGNPGFGVLVDTQLYPLALLSGRPRELLGGRNSPLNGLGLSAFVDLIPRLTSQYGYTNLNGQPDRANLFTRQFRYGIGLVFRHRFGGKATSPTVKLSAHQGRLQFAIDKGAAPQGVFVDIPNVDYRYLDPGVGIHLPLAKALAILAEGRFLVVQSAGEMQQSTQYGGGNVMAYEGEAGIEVKLSENLVVRAGGRYMAFDVAFNGTGTLATGRDGNRMTKDVSRAYDQYSSGYAQVGYRF